MPGLRITRELREENTLAFWRVMIAKLWGEDSPAVTYLDAKIKCEGSKAQVQVSFGQYLGELNEIHRRNSK